MDDVSEVEINRLFGILAVSQHVIACDVFLLTQMRPIGGACRLILCSIRQRKMSPPLPDVVNKTLPIAKKRALLDVQGKRVFEKMKLSKTRTYQVNMQCVQMSQ